MEVELVMAVLGIVVSLLFSLIPGLNAWYGKQSGEIRRLIMLAALVISVLGIWGAGCAGLYGACLEWRDVVRGFIAALVANQAVFMITPLPKAYKDAVTEGWITRMGPEPEDDVE